ncbi:MAG: hypothetical protein RJQ14_08165 [Marinoscillum sp.]
MIERLKKLVFILDNYSEFRRVTHAILFFLDYLDKNSFAIFLDDAHGIGERGILCAWSKIMDLKALVHAGKAGLITKNSSYYIAPGWNSEEMIRQL